MEIIFQDKRRRLIRQEEIVPFSLKETGLYMVTISARCKGERQFDATDDEDLRLEIDGRKFPHLLNPERHADSPAAFSGGNLHDLKKTIYFLFKLNTGKHEITLIPDISATFEDLTVFKISSETALDRLDLEIDIQAEDRKKGRPWITFVFADLSLASFSVTLTLKRRLFDSDDVKVVIDGSVGRSYRDNLRKLWYFVTSSLYGEKQSETFTVNLPPALHYLELDADRRPALERILFLSIRTATTEEIKEKIRRKARELALDPELLVRIAQFESSFDSLAVSSAGAKGIYQLTEITVKQIVKLGYKIHDIFNIDQNIAGGQIYFRWLYQHYAGTADQLEKTLAAWNWGLANVPKDKFFEWNRLPKETEIFIKNVLGTK